MKIELSNKDDLQREPMDNKRYVSFITGGFIIMAILFLLNGCSRQDTTARSMEQIYEEDGIPVRVDTVRYQKFEKNLAYFAKLSGIQEATKSAVIGGKIERINARVGDRVKRNQVVVELDQTSPGFQYEQARAAYENAEKTYQRMKAMLEAGETSQANFDGAEVQYLVAKRNYESQRKMLLVDSPFDGTVVDIKVRTGDNVLGDTYLFTVAQLDKMHARIWVTEQEVMQLRTGMSAITQFNGKTYRGTVTEISLAADPYKQAFYVDVEFNNPNHELRSGITMNIQILVYENPRAIVVPRNLVMRDVNGAFVFVLENGNAAKRYITNGNGSGIEYEVKSGLNAGDILITHGASMVDTGRLVRIVN
jgi:membrane fusion protein, multidrug efflux system